MIATAVLAADYAGTFELLDTSRIGARATQPRAHRLYAGTWKAHSRRRFIDDCDGQDSPE